MDKKDTSNFASSPSKVYAFWEDFDLEKEKLDLSEKRKKLIENQENCIKKQKIWGEGSADQEANLKSSAEASLLLDYKAEVNRANEAEKAFLEICDRIYGAVDPFPFLSICRDENKKIKWDFNEIVVPKDSEVPSDDSKEKEPRFLRDYIVLKSIAVGGFGEVFCCQKRIDKQTYAVKKIKVANDKKLESLSEVYALSRMQHRNIIRYYDAWIEPFGDYPIKKDLKSEEDSFESSSGSKPNIDPSCDALYIQMQLCNETLYTMIVSKRITDTEAWKYMIQITEGLHYLHLNRVVHRDLASKNILIDDWGDAIITDFGLAGIPNLHDLSTEKGHLPYCAPERRDVEKGTPPSPKWDIYSLGVIFVELAAGLSSEVPEIERSERIDKAKKGKFSDDIPVRDRLLIIDMLSADPEARPCTGKVLKRLQVRRK